jgi:SAM-dependent methyltransferase
MTEDVRRWQPEADRLAARSVADGDPSGWFEPLYAGGRAGEFALPWNRGEPNPLLVEWLRPGTGRAVVVGCGLGADAEHVASLGYATTAFDIAGTAVDLARERHPDSGVDYRVADLFDLPPEWRRAFDLVVEIYTVQALPVAYRPRVTATVADLVADGGRLLVIYAQGDESQSADRPPWPLTRAQVDAFATGGLTTVRVEDTADRDGNPRWRAEFTRA